MDRDLLQKLNQRIQDQEPSRVGPGAPDEYVSPKVVVYDGDDFIRSLGPAQACSPSPVPEEEELTRKSKPFY